MRLSKLRFLLLIFGVLTLDIPSLTAYSQAPGASESILWNFDNSGDGAQPFAGVIMDSSGNLCGTTDVGGAKGVGTVFKLTPPSTIGGNWTQSTLWTFGNGNDGRYPRGGLISDISGNLYGTAAGGGANGYGTVFKLTPPSTIGGGWTESILWNFGGNDTDGQIPVAGLVLDTSGNLYGTTDDGGGYGLGAVFELTPPSAVGGNWNESILWSFGTNAGADKDGTNPLAGLIMDASGNLYGTTEQGGSDYQGGTVFKLTPPSSTGGNWTESILWSFGNPASDLGTDGYNPFGGVVMDRSGNLYGTTFYGGAYAWEGAPEAYGTVFELTPPSTVGGNRSESILWSFGGSGTDGQNPGAALIMDSSGNLYGTTDGGGAYQGAGTVFELTPPSGIGGSWTESILWSFGNGNDGNSPYAGLIVDKSGNFYGTTFIGGAKGNGTVFEISSSVPPTPTPTSSPTRSPSPTLTLGGTPTTSATTTPAATLTATPAPTTTPTASATTTPTARLTATPTPTPTQTTTGTATPTRTATPTATSMATATPTAIPTATSTPGLTTTLSGAPRTLNFGNINATGTGKPKKVTLTNKGNAAAQISTVTATAPFTIAGGADTCSGHTIAPKKTCALDVDFAPAKVAHVNHGTIDVTYNGTNPAVTLEGNGIAVALTAPSRETFSSVARGNTGKPKGIKISNRTTVSVNLNAVSISGNNPGAFTITANNCRSELAPKSGNCTITMEFTPGSGAAGAQSATVGFSYTYGANNGSVSIPISGTVK